MAQDDESSQEGYTSNSEYDDYYNSSDHDMSRKIFGSFNGMTKEERDL